jgi:hypothetical protein
MTEIPLHTIVGALVAVALGGLGLYYALSALAALILLRRLMLVELISGLILIAIAIWLMASLGPPPDGVAWQLNPVSCTKILESSPLRAS